MILPITAKKINTVAKVFQKGIIIYIYSAIGELEGKILTKRKVFESTIKEL